LISDEQCEILLMACELLAEKRKVETEQHEIQMKVRELLADAFEVEVKAHECLERQKNWRVPMEATNRETVIMKIRKTKSA